MERSTCADPMPREGAMHAPCFISSLLISTCAAGQGIVWSQVANSGPSARYAHAMAFDSQRARAVLFGGFLNGGHLNDTWEWDGAAWVQRPGPGPVGRSESAMTYDSQRH